MVTIRSAVDTAPTLHHRGATTSHVHDLLPCAWIGPQRFRLGAVSTAEATCGCVLPSSRMDLRLEAARTCFLVTSLHEQRSYPLGRRTSGSSAWKDRDERMPSDLEKYKRQKRTRVNRRPPKIAHTVRCPRRSDRAATLARRRRVPTRSPRTARAAPETRLRSPAHRARNARS